MNNQNQAFFDRGRICDARYKSTGIKDYDGNPLIEALPSILPRNIAAERLAHFKDFDESERDADDQSRKHSLRALLQFFNPFNDHLDLEQRFSYAIRMGYVERNVLTPRYWQKVHEAILSSNPYDQYDDGIPYEYHSTASFGFNIAGVSGVGKSQTIRRILDIYPQVINHIEYKDKNLTERQLVWLKVDCPFDGITTSLCLDLFHAVDAILGTDSWEQYKNERPAELVNGIATVAANHHLGVLVIDEIQRLSLLKNGGHKKMLNFFVQLINTVKVPIVLVGTVKALPLFMGDFPQGRRATGQGSFIWKRMKQDEEWEDFVEAMWRYEITRRPTKKSELKGLSAVLYEETQGITDLAIKAFLFAQELAIDIGATEREGSGEVKNGEKITTAVIRSAARDKFSMLRPALDALKEGNVNALETFEDLYSEYLREYEDENNPEPNPVPPPAPAAQQPAQSAEKKRQTQVTPLIDDSIANVNQFFGSRLTGDASKNPAERESEDQKSPSPKTKSKKPKKSAKGKLIEIFDDARNRRETDMYGNLENMDYIISGDDPLISGNSEFGKQEVSK